MTQISKPRVLLSWSSGKDAAWTLHTLLQSDEVEVVGLLTTVNETFDRVAMHAVRRSLLEAQAEALGLPLCIVPIPWPCSNALYEAAMAEALDRAKETLGITHVAFGDLFLDVREYREKQFAGTGITPLFPLWAKPTRALAEEMIAGGLKAILTCIDPRRLHASFLGRVFDSSLLADLPPDVDPCGETGEFHTFAYAVPDFARSLSVVTGEVVEREGFLFVDILSADNRMEREREVTA